MKFTGIATGAILIHVLAIIITFRLIPITFEDFRYADTLTGGILFPILVLPLAVSAAIWVILWAVFGNRLFK